MDALTAFASLGLYAMSPSQQQELPRDLLLDALEAMLVKIVEDPIKFFPSVRPNAVAVSGARAVAAWLKQRKSEMASLSNIFIAILDILTGEDQRALTTLGRLTPQERIQVYRALGNASDVPPFALIVAMLRDRRIGWYSLINQTDYGFEAGYAMSVAIERMGKLESSDLLKMLSNITWDSINTVRKARRYIMGALNRAQTRLPPEKLSLLRCLFGANDSNIPASPSDWAVVLRACEDAPSTEVKHAVLTLVGENSAQMLLSKTIQDCLRRGELDAQDALQLLQIAIPFLGMRGGSTAALIRESFSQTPQLVQDEVDLCIRLWRNTVSDAELELLAARQDPIGAMAAARVAQRSPQSAGACTLRYPYYLVADLSDAIEQAPMAVLKALAEETSPVLFDKADLQLRHLAWHLCRLNSEKVAWCELTAAQRGVLLGAWLSQKDILPQSAQEAIDQCLEGLNASEVSVVANQVAAIIERLGVYNAMSDFYRIVYNRFTDLENTCGYRIYLPSPYIAVPHGTPLPEAAVRYIRAGDADSYRREIKRIKTPEEAAQLAKALVGRFPDPAKANWECVRYTASWAVENDKHTQRAFLDALSPRWQIAITIITNGRILSQLGKQYQREFIARFPPREQALLATLKPIREALGKANAPRPLNKVDFQAAVAEFVDDVPDQIEYATPSPKARALINALLGKGRTEAVPAAVFEYAASIQRGHYPLAAAAPTPLPVIPRRLERPNPRAR